MKRLQRPFEASSNPKGKGMNGIQTLTAILSIAVIVGGGCCFRTWLAAQSHDRQIALEARKNEQETGRLRILADFILRR